MRNPIKNNIGLISRSIAAGLVLLLVLAGWTPAAAARKIELDWPQVQAVKPGTPITVVLHKNQGLRGNRKARGRFQSATDDSLTLKMEYGPMRTLPRSAVRKVLVHRPKRNRVWSWVQAVKPGTRTKVILYQDQGPQGNRKIKGHFRSATDDSLTLKLPYGPLRTFQKAAIRQVLVGSKRLWSRVQAVKPGT